MLSIIFTILFTIGSAYYDSRILRSGRYITNHTPRFIFRALSVFLITLLFSKYKNDTLYTVLMFILNSSIFYLLFDYLINLFWGKYIFRIGTTAFIDKIWLILGGSVSQIIFKILLVLAVSIFIVKCSKTKSHQNSKVYYANNNLLFFKKY